MSNQNITSLRRETTDNLHIRQYRPHFFKLNDGSEWADTPIAILNKEVFAEESLLPTSFDQLAESHFKAWLDLKPTVILIGTGDKMKFLDPKWQAFFYQKGIGIETMPTESLCRTFTILAVEDRNALGIFFPIHEKKR